MTSNRGWASRNVEQSSKVCCLGVNHSYHALPDRGGLFHSLFVQPEWQAILVTFGK